MITAGGIHGKIKEIREAYILLEISDGVSIRIDKGSVYPSAADAQAETEAKKIKPDSIRASSSFYATH